jgi:hypothetical protein
MEAQIERALETDLTIDITTKGRVSGESRRIEIWFHNVDGAIYITGTPGKRDWHANLLVEPSFTFHLKESVQADLAAVAIPITDEAVKRRVLAVVVERVNSTKTLDDWVANSPLVRVEFEE